MVSRTVKPLNAFHGVFSYLKSSVTSNGSIKGMPVSAGMELTNNCNLKCPECASGSGQMTRSRGNMEIDLYEKIVRELQPYLYNINLYFQGEPMLHPRFFDFLEITQGTKVTVSTNGHFLSQENAEKLARSGLHKIIVSLDGMDRETYSLYRQDGEFEKVINGIKYLSQAIRNTRSILKLEIQFLVNRHNESQIASVSRFSKGVNAALKLKSMQIINNEHIDYWMPEKEKYKRYRKNNGTYTLKNTFSNNCLRLWLNPVVTFDGKVVPCCFDKNADHIMGDLNKSSFREIWHGEKFKIFRDSVLKGRSSVEICRNCTSGLKGVRY
jgi:radical SAM protein with 4Fe4S-binding SPASM domain